jgi:hypothetical protein
MEHHPCTPSKVYKTKHIRWVFSRIPSYEHTECVEFLGCFTIKTFHWVKQEAGIYKAVFSWDGKDEYEL